MVTSVTLGNFFTTSGGKTVLGGTGGSGLDTETLVNALVAAKQLPATQKQDQIDINSEKVSALNTFNSLLSIFKSAADALRNPPGVANAADNAFQFRSATVTADTGTGSDYVTVTAEPGAARQSYTITNVTSLAKAARQSTGVFLVADADTSITSVDAIVPATPQFQPGTITVNGQNITFEEGDSLNVIAARFNAVSDDTGISASVIQVAEGSFQLSFSATDTGESGDFDLSDIGTVSSDPDGVLDLVTFDAAVGGVNANFEINGVAVERESNDIDDVITGLTFHLHQLTAGAEVTVAITPDTTVVQNSIVNFVNAYNALLSFEAEQTEIDSSGGYAETAVLANNQTFRNIIADIRSKIISDVSGLSGDNSLAAIGITLTTQPATDELPAVDNILTISDSTLASALATDFSQVSQIFGFKLTSDNPNLRVFSANNSLTVSTFTLDVDITNGVYEATYDLDDGNGPQTVSLTATLSSSGTSYLLEGVDGTVLEGLQLIYASTSDASIEVTVTQGIAHKAYNSVDAATQYSTGTLAVELDSLADEETRLNEEIDRINDQVSQYQELLLAKFAALEQAIARVNNLLKSLDSNDQAYYAANQ